MAVYNSMVLWIAIVSIMFRVFQGKYFQSSQDRLYYIVPRGIVFLTFGYITFWAAIRSGVADTAGYIFMFQHAPSNLGEIFKYWNVNEKAPGFNSVQVLVKHFTSNYHIWLSIIAIVSTSSIAKILRKYSADFFLSAYLFATTLCFFWLFNGIRQFLVAAIVFGNADLIFHRKTGRFLLLITILSTIHLTALIYIPVYFIIQEKPFGKKMVLFTFVILLISLFVGRFTSAVDNVLSGTTYSGYSEQFAFDDGVHPLRFLVSIVPVALSFIFRDRYDWSNEPVMSLCVNLSAISAGLYFVGIFTSGILVGRFPIYFEMFNLILFPCLINKMSPSNRKIIRIFLIIGFFMYYIVQMRGSYYISDLTGLIT